MCFIECLTRFNEYDRAYEIVVRKRIQIIQETEDLQVRVRTINKGSLVNLILDAPLANAQEYTAKLVDYREEFARAAARYYSVSFPESFLETTEKFNHTE